MSGRTSLRRRRSRAIETQAGKPVDAYAARVQAAARKGDEPVYTRAQGLSDQHAERSVLLTQNGARAVVRLDVALGSPIDLARAAAKGGVVLADAKTRNEVARQIGLITEWPQAVYVVRQPGC